MIRPWWTKEHVIMKTSLMLIRDGDKRELVRDILVWKLKEIASSK